MATRTVQVKAFPCARKEQVVQLNEEAFEIYIRESAQGNMANMRVRECIAMQFGVTLDAVRLQTGHRSRKKVFVVTN